MSAKCSISRCRVSALMQRAASAPVSYTGPCTVRCERYCQPAVAQRVDADVPEAEGALRVRGAAAARAHAPHRDGDVAVQLDLLRIHLAPAVAARQGSEPLRPVVDAAHRAARGPPVAVRVGEVARQDLVEKGGVCAQHRRLDAPLQLQHLARAVGLGAGQLLSGGLRRSCEEGDRDGPDQQAQRPRRLADLSPALLAIRSSLPSLVRLRCGRRSTSERIQRRPRVGDQHVFYDVDEVTWRVFLRVLVRTRALLMFFDRCRIFATHECRIFAETD